jgi:hypothetical protein
MVDGNEYSRRIAQALSIDTPSDSIHQVKREVSSELRALDPAMVITETDYFNHSFAPDLVASWPSDPTTPDRFIYLKVSSQLDFLLNDVTLVKDQRPIVFGLSPTPSGNVSVAREIRETAQRSDTLVTDADGLEELIEGNNSRFVKLASNAVAQGGRGVVDQAGGAQAAEALNAGFDAALATEPSLTRTATSTLGTLLDARHADRMTRLLQAVWVGSGGRFENFPGPKDLASDIADEALQFLLEYEEIDDLSFWRRIGSRVSIAQLGRLQLLKGSANLDHLIQANIHTLAAGTCRVLARHRELADAVGMSRRWLVERELLALRGADFIAYFAANLDDISNVRRKRSAGITVDDLARRARGLIITEADLATAGRRTVKVISEDRTDLVDDIKSGKTYPEATRSTEVRVKRAGAFLGNDRVLSCDFQTFTATRRTNSRTSLSDLVGAGIPLLHDVTPVDLERIARIVNVEEEDVLFERSALLLERPKWRVDPE